MFRCLECGIKFEKTLELIETHGLDTPPFEKRYVCPECKGSGYKPLVKDNISRREVLDKLVDIMRALNEFELPRDIDQNIFDMTRSQEAAVTFNILTKNIEG